MIFTSFFIDIFNNGLLVNNEFVYRNVCMFGKRTFSLLSPPCHLHGANCQMLDVGVVLFVVSAPYIFPSLPDLFFSKARSEQTHLSSLQPLSPHFHHVPIGR